MRAASTTLLLALAVLVAALPGFAQGPPGGKGGGPPSWAGGGGGKGGPPAWAGGAKGNGGGPPAWAGGRTAPAAPMAAGKAKKQKAAARRAEREEKRGRARKTAGKNPAMTCFGKLDELGEAFAELFGTNGNRANAFGMCVSQEARGQGGDDAPEEEAEEDAACDAPAEATKPTLASLQHDTLVEDPCEPADGGTDDVIDEAPGEGTAARFCFAQASELGDLFADDHGTSPFAACVSTA